MINKTSNDEVKLQMKGSTSKLVVLVDDEPDILELVGLHLSKAGFKVKTFEDGESFFKFIKTNLPDLVILDLMLPDSDGFEICKYLKKEDKYSSVPVIMLTARADEMDAVLGLELGADDYVTKPFSPRELVARVKAVLRRDDKVIKSQVIKVADILKIDLQKYDVFVNDVVNRFWIT